MIHAKICFNVVNTEADHCPSTIYKEQMKKIPPLPSSHTVLSCRITQMLDKCMSTVQVTILCCGKVREGHMLLRAILNPQTSAFSWMDIVKSIVQSR